MVLSAYWLLSFVLSAVARTVHEREEILIHRKTNTCIHRHTRTCKQHCFWLTHSINGAFHSVCLCLRCYYCFVDDYMLLLNSKKSVLLAPQTQYNNLSTVNFIILHRYFIRIFNIFILSIAHSNERKTKSAEEFVTYLVHLYLITFLKFNLSNQSERK